MSPGRRGLGVRARLCALASGAALVAVVIGDAFLYRSVTATLSGALTEELRSHAQDVAAELAAAGATPPLVGHRGRDPGPRARRGRRRSRFRAALARRRGARPAGRGWARRRSHRVGASPPDRGGAGVDLGWRAGGGGRGQHGDHRRHRTTPAGPVAPRRRSAGRLHRGRRVGRDQGRPATRPFDEPAGAFVVDSGSRRTASGAARAGRGGRARGDPQPDARPHRRGAGPGAHLHR